MPHHHPNVPDKKPMPPINAAPWFNLFGNLLTMFNTPGHEHKNIPEPKIEVSENKNNIVVTAELPGIEEQNIDLETSNGYLTISYDKRQENFETCDRGCFSEISYGHISRTIPLPWNLDYSKAKAKYNNGLLNITIPKIAQLAEGRSKINIEKPSKSDGFSTKNNETQTEA